MKELSIEEKARRYDKALERTIHFLTIIGVSPNEKPIEAVKRMSEYIFPELVESEDNEDLNILQRFSFYSYKDEPNILYLSGLYVAEEYRNKGIGTRILEVTDEVAKSLDCYAIRLKTKKGSNAEKLYQTHGYNSLAIEGRDEIWLEKQGEKSNNVYDKELSEILGCVMRRYINDPNIPYTEREKVSMKVLPYVERLEKQGEQKPTDNVEPKFKVGDWVIGLATNNEPRQISKITDQYYKSTYGGWYGFSFENDMHLWSIEDAKDGDVLCCESGWTCIFKALDNNTNTFSSYCFMDNTKWFCETGCECHTLDKAFIKAYNGEIYPATKEQCDILFQKMKEAGYEWDAEKKELKKIERKPWSEEDIATISRVISIVKWAAYSDHSHPILNDKGATELVERLESLKDRLQPQSTWKPNDEQMDALCYVTNFDYGGHKAILVSLYEQLKKL